MSSFGKPMAKSLKLVRHAGWIFASLALVLAALALAVRAITGDELAEPLILAFMAVFPIGFLLLAVSSVIRIFKGDVRLRPLNAVKSAMAIFGFMIVCHLVVMAIFPSWQRDWAEILLRSLAIAAGMGLYMTAYRRPA